MKYLVIVPDGAADEPLESLGGKTPLEMAEISNINDLARHGQVGFVQTIPDGVSPGSDAANLAVLGYDPVCDLTGRSPLEAVSMGIDMSFEDVSFRTNLVALQGTSASFNSEESYEDLSIIDHSAGDISNEEARELILFIDKNLGSGAEHPSKNIKFYPGVSYRHALIARDGLDTKGIILEPPHDHLGQVINDFLPKGENASFIKDMMKQSYNLLKDHPINQKRIAKGKNPANSIWIWGMGTRPRLDSFVAKFGIDGTVISAVDLIKGIGICAGLKTVDVVGATGTLDTNYCGKAEAAILSYKDGYDLAYIHIEAPDECSHQGSLEGKLESLERIDKKIISPLVNYLRSSGDDFRILIVPDHRTPVLLRTHTADPVPYVIYDSRLDIYCEDNAFSETSAENGRFFESGAALADEFFGAK